MSKALRRCHFVLRTYPCMIRTVLLGIEIIQWSSVFPISYYTLVSLRIFFDRPETHQDWRPASSSMEHSCLWRLRCNGSNLSSRLQTCYRVSHRRERWRHRLGFARGQEVHLLVSKNSLCGPSSFETHFPDPGRQ